MKNDGHQKVMPFEGMIAEQETRLRINQDRLSKLQDCLHRLGYSENESLSRILLLIFHVTKNSDGVLRWTNQRIGDDQSVQRSARTVSRAIATAKQLGLVTAEQQILKRRGKAENWLRLHWRSIIELATDATTVTTTDTSSDTTTDRTTDTTTDTSNAAHTIVSSFPNSTSTKDAAEAVAEIENLLSKAGVTLAKRIAAELIEKGTTAQAVSQAIRTLAFNRSKLPPSSNEPAILVFFLRNDAWPLEGLKSPPEASEVAAKVAAKRQKAKIDAAAAEEDRKLGQRIAQLASEIDSEHSDDSLGLLARQTLSEAVFELLAPKGLRSRVMLEAIAAELIEAESAVAGNP